MRFAVYARAHGKGLEVHGGICPYVDTQISGYANQKSKSKIFLLVFSLIRIIDNLFNY